MMTISEIYEVGCEFFEGGNFFVEIHPTGVRFVNETIKDGKTVTESHFMEVGLDVISPPAVREFIHASKKEPNYSTSW
ncbi:TPA: hypothetical protein ACTW80_001226 [Klebsiella pneumoniae]